MKHAHRSLRTVFAGALAAVALASHAQTPAPERLQPASTIEFVTGGVGMDEHTAMKQMAREYPLRVVMSGRDGAYFVAQDFKLMQDGRVVLSLPSAGPWLLADVPPGRYTVEGVFDGETMRRAFTLPAAGSTVHWVLPARLD